MILWFLTVGGYSETLLPDRLSSHKQWLKLEKVVQAGFWLWTTSRCQCPSLQLDDVVMCLSSLPPATTIVFPLHTTAVSSRLVGMEEKCSTHLHFPPLLATRLRSVLVKVCVFINEPPTNSSQITVRVKYSLWHLGEDRPLLALHVSEVYECTCLLPPSLMYALLPHTVASNRFPATCLPCQWLFLLCLFLVKPSSPGQVTAHCLNCGQLQCTYSAPVSSSLCVKTVGVSLATVINHHTSIIF